MAFDSPHEKCRATGKRTLAVKSVLPPWGPGGAACPGDWGAINNSCALCMHAARRLQAFNTTTTSAQACLLEHVHHCLPPKESRGAGVKLNEIIY